MKNRILINSILLALSIGGIIATAVWVEHENSTSVHVSVKPSDSTPSVKTQQLPKPIVKKKGVKASLRYKASATDTRPARRPKMPWKPTGSGKLNGLVLILDPGHGGRDPGCGWSLVLENRAGDETTVTDFTEASYTYVMVKELADQARQQGASVYLTEYSSVMEDADERPAQQSAPLPLDAVFMLDGLPSITGTQGLTKRARLANRVAKKYAAGKNCQRVVFLSIHVDSMPEGWQGAHVCVDPTQDEHVPVAEAIARQFVRLGYARKKDRKIVRPVDRRSLCVLRASRAVPDRALVEVATPVDLADSWRLRSAPHRQAFLSHLVTALAEVNQRR